MTTGPLHTAFDLTGRRALVTGCRRGIGLAMAEALAAAGADIVGASANMELGDSDVRGRVEALGRSFAPIQVDLADRTAVGRFTSELTSSGRRIDILVNNAGAIRRSPVANHSDDDWDHVVAVDLTAPFILTREIGRTMVERGEGKIIFVASLLSFQGGLRVPSYVAAKSGIAGLTKAFANEWAPRGVNVNAIAPGYIVTDVTSDLRQDRARSDAILQRIPAGRWGQPGDVAGLTVLLASDAAAYINGAVVPVDGGWMGR